MSIAKLILDWMGNNVFLTIILLIASGSVFTWIAREMEKGFKHRRKLAQMKLALLHRQSRQASEIPIKAVEELRREIAALRDTTTQYDMSFDTALQRLESRISHMENQVSEIKQQEVGQR